MSFDPECLKLAEYFLSEVTDHPAAERDLLAQHIQDAIERWLRGYEEDLSRDAAREPQPGDTP